MRDVLTLLLAGGKGERLYPLTKNMSKPAVSYGGRYRLIDFTLTNCLYSGLDNVNVFIQYELESLENHLKNWDKYHNIDIAPRYPKEELFKGSKDAVEQHKELLDEEDYDAVLVLSADHVYRMDYNVMLDFHNDTGSDITIATKPSSWGEVAGKLGVLRTDDKYRVRDFIEKPLESPYDDKTFRTSLGIYVIKPEVMREIIRMRGDDFGKHIMPRVHRRYITSEFPFESLNVIMDKETKKSKETFRRQDSDYWLDAGTVPDYFDSHKHWLGEEKRFDAKSTNWPINTFNLEFPPADIGNIRELFESLVSEGCRIKGRKTEVVRSVLSPAVYVEDAKVKDSILLYDSKIGPGADMENTIVGRHVFVPEGTRIGKDREEDERRFQPPAEDIAKFGVDENGNQKAKFIHERDDGSYVVALPEGFQFESS